VKQTPLVLRNGLMAAAGLAFFVATVGVPLPVGRTKDRSIPFPCMDRTCGCHDAAGCKAHCCCFSSEEKLAWAAEHRVDPTPFVDDAALKRAQVHTPRGYPGFTVQEGAQARCCKKKIVACCAKDGVTDFGSKHATASVADVGLPAQTLDEPRNANPHDHLVSIAAYRQCNGLQPLWTLLNAALPPPDTVRFEFEFLPTGHVAERYSTLTTVSFSPATPPPRA
jgi:hypothetical protein